MTSIWKNIWFVDLCHNGYTIEKLYTKKSSCNYVSNMEINIEKNNSHLAANKYNKFILKHNMVIITND